MYLHVELEGGGGRGLPWPCAHCLAWMPWTVKKDETSAFLLISYNFSGPCIRFMFSGYIFSVCLIDIISGYLIDIFYRVCVLTVCMRMLSRLASSILRHSLGLASHAIIVFSIVASTWTPPPPRPPLPRMSTATHAHSWTARVGEQRPTLLVRAQSLNY